MFLSLLLIKGRMLITQIISVRFRKKGVKIQYYYYYFNNTVSLYSAQTTPAVTDLLIDIFIGYTWLHKLFSVAKVAVFWFVSSEKGESWEHLQSLCINCRYALKKCWGRQGCSWTSYVLPEWKEILRGWEASSVDCSPETQCYLRFCAEWSLVCY